MAVQYCNYDIKGTLAVTGTSTLSGIVTITEATSNPLLNIYNTSNGSGATIRFSDQTSQIQVGDITFYHSDGSSQGGGASWHFVSQPDTVLVVGSSSVNGRFVSKSAGSSSEVDYGFYDDVDTGMYRAGANSLRLVAGGISGVSVSATGVELRYAGSTKLQTTSGGVTVTGDINTSGNANINGGNITINGSYPRFNMYSNDAGEDDWAIINNNGIFGIYNNTATDYALSISETVNTVIINSGNIQLNGTGRITGVDTVSAGTDAANKDYVDTAVGGVSSGVTSVATTNGITGGTITSTGTIQVDSTVVRTTGNQSVGGIKTFSTYIGMQEDHYVNYRFEMIENDSPQYILLCRNAASNDVNGVIRMDRTSGNYQAASVEVIVSSGSGAMYGGTLRTLQVLQQTEDYRLISCTYNGGNWIAIKYSGNTYPETSGAYFTGRIKSTSTFLTVVSSGVTNEASFGGTTESYNEVDSFVISGDATISGGDITLGGTGRIQGIDTVSASTDAANKAYVDAHVSPAGTYLPLLGGTMSGNIAMGDNNITGLSQLAFTDNIRFDDLGADNYLRLTYGDAGPGGLQIYDGDNTLQGYLFADGGATSSFGLLDGTGSWQ